jgi:dTDP-4-dehydrorhamnose reductase
MKIVITGSNGFVGKRILSELNKKNRYQLIDVDINPEAKYQIDVSNYSTFSDFLMETKPDAIIHCAAIKDLETCEKNKVDAFKTNVLSTEAIVKYTLNSCPDCKVIYISSDVIFDGRDGNYLRKSQPNPINWYGKTKVFSEILLRNIKNSAIYRTSLVIGALENKYKKLLDTELNNESLQNQTLLPHYIYGRIKKGRKVYLPKNVISNPTPVNLITHTINKSLTDFKPGTFHIAGPEAFSRFNFAIKIAERFDLDKRLIIPDKKGISPLRPLDISLDIDKSFEILGINKDNWTFDKYVKSLNLQNLK